MNRTLRENLKERFDAVKFAYEHKSPRYGIFLNEYLQYISLSKELGGIVKEIINKGLITKEFLHKMFYLSSLYVNKNFVDPTDYVEVSFFDKEIDQKYNLTQNLLKEMDLEIKKSKIRMSTMSPAEAEAEMSERVKIFRGTSDELLELMSMNSLILEGLSSEKKNTVAFDLDKSLLVVGGRDVQIKKFGNEYNTLKVIFTEPGKEWFYSEISEKIDMSESPDEKQISNSIYQTSQKLKIIGVDDLFIKTNQSVKINQKYLT